MSKNEDLTGRHSEEEHSPPSADSKSSSLLPGSQLGQFRIEREIGRGGMGIVYLAHDDKLDRSVAIKSVPPELAADETVRSRFLREAKLLASLNHPSIATLYDIVEVKEGTSYLVMEYIPGETLAERLVRGPVALPEALPMAVQIAQALVAAHEHRVVHRDLKPGNIKLLPDGRVKVLDFGLGKMNEPNPSDQTTTTTQPGRVMGTPAYMSPEQARGQTVDERSDIWSFGCVAYESLTGKLPFMGATQTDVMANVLARDPDWRALPKELRPEGRRIILRCLEKQPEKRFQSSQDLYQAIQQHTTTLSGTVLDMKALERSVRRPKVLAAVVLLVLAVSFVVFGIVQRSIRINNATRDVAEILGLIETDRYLEAFLLAERAKDVIPEDPTLKTLWPEMSKAFSALTDPPGAEIYFRDFRDVEGEPLYLGTSPLSTPWFPYGLFRFEIRKAGFDTLERIIDTFPEGSDKLVASLQVAGRYPDMLRFSAETDYYIDKYEVTNRAYKAFVDQGGYENPDYWKQVFQLDGRELSFQEAMSHFRDQTNRQGPATWEGGTYAEGQDDYPVGGLSWFEAAAYAEFAGKSLPPLPYWNQAASDWGAVVLPHSNFSGALAPVGEFRSITPNGLYDMAGNVREWCFNAPDETHGRRYIRGGGYDDPGYMFWDWELRSPWNRDRANGFRCVLFPSDQNEAPQWLFAPRQVARHVRTSYPVDYQPKSAAEIRGFVDDFAYDPRELKAEIVEEDDSPRYWLRQKITYTAAYNNETISAYLFLPKQSRPPYQPVLYFPGTGAQKQSSSESLRDFDAIDYVIKSGRAVLYPVYKGTYERQFTRAEGKNARRAWVQQLSKDISRSIDYLSERDDMEMDKLTYYGMSWGAFQGPVYLVTEAERIKFAMLFVGGLLADDLFHERVDPIHYVPHVRMPILMINGTMDSTFPLETSAKPMYDLLGSEDKHQVTFEGGHNLFGLTGTKVKGDVLQWMDEHLGPVR